MTVWHPSDIGTYTTHTHMHICTHTTYAQTKTLTHAQPHSHTGTPTPLCSVTLWWVCWRSRLPLLLLLHCQEAKRDHRPSSRASLMHSRWDARVFVCVCVCVLLCLRHVNVQFWVWWVHTQGGVSAAVYVCVYALMSICSCMCLFNACLFNARFWACTQKHQK